jgi:hypothetical protein
VSSLTEVVLMGKQRPTIRIGEWIRIAGKKKLAKALKMGLARALELPEWGRRCRKNSY